MYLFNMEIEAVDFKTQINTEVLTKEIIVTNQDEYAHWGDVLKLCKNKVKEVEEERKNYTKPLDEAKARLMEKEKSITTPIKEYMARIEAKMTAWFLEEDKKRQEEQKRLEEEAVANAKPEDTDILVPVVESAKTVRSTVATTSAIKYNEYEVLDEMEVPREYLMLDDKKIKEAINKGQVKEIKGLKIIETARLTSR